MFMSVFTAMNSLCFESFAVMYKRFSEVAQTARGQEICTH